MTILRTDLIGIPDLKSEKLAVVLSDLGFGKSKKSMLVKDIAKIHEQNVGNVNLLINRNRKRFKDNIDIIDLKHKNFAIVLSKSGFTQNQINATKNIYLLSERGYAKVLKIIEDDKA